MSLRLRANTDFGRSRTDACGSGFVRRLVLCIRRVLSYIRRIIASSSPGGRAVQYSVGILKIVVRRRFLDIVALMVIWIGLCNGIVRPRSRRHELVLPSSTVQYQKLSCMGHGVATVMAWKVAVTTDLRTYILRATTGSFLSI